MPRNPSTIQDVTPKGVMMDRQTLNFTPLVTQSSKTKKHKNGKRNSTNHHHLPTTTGPPTGLLVGGCSARTGTLLQFHPGQSEGDPNSAKPNPPSQSHCGSADQSTGSFWTSLLWQSMVNSDSSFPLTDPQALNNHILQSFQTLPFFPDMMKEDPATEPVFVMIDQPTQNNPSCFAPKGKSNSPPLQNIQKGISKALEILKKKNASEEQEMPYAAPRTDSLLLDSVRSIEFSTEPAR
ncbi:hypothetical protein A4A49_03241 [Nicotiana attenuata]|uniref:Uncharacterized protein n=1 Tax=Nicotiana attenuata TaxID=49451 RepID=A0A314L3X8_NICAT|nr:hypothetical protein A4A49_03241 [Nicotiana attenuata]